jgi:flagellar operon protein
MTDQVQNAGRAAGSAWIRPTPSSPQVSAEKASPSRFDEVLQKEVTRQQEVRFSHHALDRLRLRNIQLTPTDMESLGGAVQRVEEKGGQDSLVLMNGVAFVVNIPSRTVVTAIDDAHLRQNVFTQIDSAVIA